MLHAKIFLRQYILLVFTALACLGIQKGGHAKAVNTNKTSEHQNKTLISDYLLDTWTLDIQSCGALAA
jgi:hypothetical protein